MQYDIVVHDNSRAIIEQMKQQGIAALEECGLRAEGYAKSKAPVGTPESTGIVGYVTNGMRQSITHKVVDSAVYIGTNKRADNGVFYPAYVEFGTGIYASNGQGRQNPWTWYDKNGKGHFTYGMKPVHFLRDSVADHKEEYKRVFLKYLKGDA